MIVFTTFIAVVVVIAVASCWAVLSWRHHSRPVVQGPGRVLISALVGTVVVVAIVAVFVLKVLFFCDPPNCF